MKTKNITVNFSKRKLPNLIRRHPSNLIKGMTLIELLVVLGILAALAGMTLSFVGEMNTAARQNVTKNKLEQIESAIVGDPTHSSRFLNDMGRLPVKIDGNGSTLSELWNNQLFNPKTNDPFIKYNGYENDITTNLTNNIPFYITIHGGWKGPYLNVTNQKLYDGFGNDFYVADPEASAKDKITGWDDQWKEDEEDEEMEKMIELNPTGTILKFGSFGEDDTFNIPDNSGTTTTTTAWQNTDVIKEFRHSQVFSTLHVNILLRDCSTNPATWLPPKFIENKVKPYDKNSTTYTTGSIVEVTINEKEYLFICTHSPSSASASEEPTWSCAGVVTDKSGREWIWLSRTTYLNQLRVVVFSPYVETELNENTPKKSTLVRTATAFYPHSNSQNNEPTIWGHDLKIFQPSNDYLGDTDDLLPAVEILGNGMGTKVNNKNGDTINEMTFHNLTPGIRKIFAYGYVKITEQNENGNESEKTPYSNARHS
ncbi:MAG: type II secretion system GspH family protein, partial [Planctomycetaceae bacterium]|nr:type II secretion system GspH family protein [Planctomycetaceae bacterium]